ncbi:unnamed protein product [Chironomus riparius]|uniref:Uncharacterized protein n=1 Tax=Chironomus riparius TaxID=315576 RepID=A0A9N9WRB2_9DIPT|nr:unnamed protein product [Chironomus riparius]
MPTRSSAKIEKSTLNRCENLQQYCLNSSLHGLRYIGTTSLSAFERIFFGVSFAFVFVLAAYFISNIWQKWNDSPVIISGNPITTKIKDIPFPAVTICNMNQVRKSFAINIRSKRDKLILDSICTSGDGLKDNLTDFEGKWSYVRQFFLNASQPCHQMIQFCKFGMRIVNCDEIFTTVLTDEGLCCTFNAFHPKLMFKTFEEDDHIDNTLSDFPYATWNPENGYNNVKPPYPRPVPGAGYHFGLSLLLDVDVANYYCSSTRSYGFKALLHSPVETAKMANFGFFISPGLETKVVITPKISEATNLIRRVPMQQRQCVFASENNLSYYNIYSKKNCEMECNSKLTESECGCTLYFMPRKYDNESKICSRLEAPCYENIIYKIQNTMNGNLSCNHCLPACFEINYGREISSSILGTGSFQTVEPQLSRVYNANYIRDNLAVVHISLNENAYSGNTKNELIGFTEFLSNTGGLLGLFMGFSVISLMEIIYFLSLRPYCALRRADVDENVQQRNNRNHVNVRLPNKKNFLSSHGINDHYGRNDMFKRKSSAIATTVSICEDLQTKFISGLRSTRQKASNTWVTLSEIYRDESQAPYPYLN